MRRLQLPGMAWLWLVMLCAGIDQLTKVLIIKSFSYGQTKALLPGLNLTLAYNPGVAFGWLSDGQRTSLYLLGLTGLITVSLLVWLLKTPKNMKAQAFSLALIVGGAIGNMVDRVVQGHVIDFIDFHINDWHWHTFNAADTFITVGAALLILSSFRRTS